MARPSKHDGVVYQTKRQQIWWMRYRDKTGRRRLESTNTTDWDEAQRRLRERLQSRDNNTLDVVRKGKQLTFNEWADFFLENYSKPPIRAREDARGQRERAEDAETCVRTMKLAGHRCDADRGAPATSAPAEEARSPQSGHRANSGP